MLKYSIGHANLFRVKHIFLSNADICSASCEVPYRVYFRECELRSGCRSGHTKTLVRTLFRWFAKLWKAVAKNRDGIR
jgi:hypothetical protein